MMKRERIGIMLAMMCLFFMLGVQMPMTVHAAGGSENDPVIVSSFADLKASMENTDITYVQLQSNQYMIPLVESGSSSSAISVKGTKVLILNGNTAFTVPNRGITNSLFGLLTSSAHLTIQGSGKLTFRAVLEEAVNSVVWLNESTASLTVNDPDVTLSGEWSTNVYGRAVFAERGTVTITAGTFQGECAKEDADELSAVCIRGTTIANINGGTFRYVTFNYTPTKLFPGLDIADSTATVSLGGGTFKNGIHVPNTKKIDDYLASDCELTSFDEGTVSVTLPPLVLADSLFFDFGAGRQGTISTSSETLVPFGGKGPYVFSVDPVISGLSIDSSNKVVFTRPDVAEARTANIVVTDATGATASIEISIGAVTALPELIFPDSSGFDVPAGNAGTVYTSDMPFAAADGTEPYTYTVNPAVTGLSINSANELVYHRPLTSTTSKNATIQVTDSTGAIKTITVAIGEVTPVPPVDILVTKLAMKASTTIKKGKTETLAVTVTPSNATNKAVTFSSSNKAVATVNASGKITAVAPGTAVITVKAADAGKKTAKCTVTVVDNTQYTVTVSGGTASVSKGVKGTAVTLTAGAVPAEKHFVKWSITSGTATLSNATKTSAGLTIGSTNVSVKAVYEAHNFKWVTDVEPTAATEGNKHRECTVCKYKTQKGTIIPRTAPAPATNRETFVDQMYWNILGRTADEAGKAYWVAALTAGTESGATIAGGFVFSEEFIAGNYSDTEYLNILYRAFFGREADAAGFQYWMDYLEKGVSREWVFKGFLAAEEYQKVCQTCGIQMGTYEHTENRDVNPNLTAYISRCYTKALVRGYDVEGLNYWTGLILYNGVSAKEAAKSFILSEEFCTKNLGNEEYVKVLYRTFFGREYDDAGFAYWMGLMNTGAVDRAQVLQSFADSAEFKAIMDSYGVQ